VREVTIFHKTTGAVLYRSTAATIKKALTEAVKAGTELSDANLRGANRTGANLEGADLRGADLP
jgi:uncharacterized protein YjbI with pentapeptide repeats